MYSQGLAVYQASIRPCDPICAEQNSACHEGIGDPKTEKFGDIRNDSSSRGTH